jgi:hypothetical protein
MVNGVKNTLIVCITILVSCVLLISYNEYTNRYILITTSDNILYIFDKKSTILNKCSGNECAVIETKLPAKVFFPDASNFSPSKLFDSEKSMRDEVVKVNAARKDELQRPTESQTEATNSPSSGSGWATPNNAEQGDTQTMNGEFVE